MHNFQPVAGLEQSRGPSLTVNQVTVQLNRNPVGFHTEHVDQGCERQSGCEFASLAIDVEFHADKIFAGTGATHKEANFVVPCAPWGKELLFPAIFAVKVAKKI